MQKHRTMLKTEVKWSTENGNDERNSKIWWMFDFLMNLFTSLHLYFASLFIDCVRRPFINFSSVTDVDCWFWFCCVLFRIWFTMECYVLFIYFSVATDLLFHVTFPIAVCGCRLMYFIKTRWFFTRKMLSLLSKILFKMAQVAYFRPLNNPAQHIEHSANYT